MQRSIESVVETLKNARQRNRSCTLLIGAGCSVKAGIPLASKFTEIIKERFPESYRRAQTKTYPQCMAELSFSERRDLIAEFVDRAKINWAHVCIAQLIKNDYIDRVLTVNFDPLVVRACALLGRFPAVYDFAASQRFKPADIPDQAIFYLHGQRSGFVILNTDTEVKELSKHLEPVFSDAGRGRVWIVVGYSGENDPVFEHLVQIDRFDNRLYWVCYKDEEPPAHVREKLLTAGKDAYYVKGFDADDFFVTLAQKLGIFPPDLIGKPFSHLEQLLQMLTPYSLPGQDAADAAIDATSSALEQIREAITRYGETLVSGRAGAKETTAALVRKVNDLFLAGDYGAVTSIAMKHGEELTPEIANKLAWSYINQGMEVMSRALATSGKEADDLFAQSYEKYAAAAQTHPRLPQLYNNWGVALISQGLTKSGAEAAQLFGQALEKLEAAIELKPSSNAYNNSGLAQTELAKLSSGEAAVKLLSRAFENFDAALKINEKNSSALNHWGLALTELARGEPDPKVAQGLFRQAREKYQMAVEIEPKYANAWDSWATTLAEQAKLSRGKAADRLFAEAFEKFEEATKLKPNYHEAFNNWSLALSEQAKMKSGKAAERLQKLAQEKYEAARRLRSDLYPERSA